MGTFLYGNKLMWTWTDLTAMEQTSIRRVSLT